jgi:hypothetical protein
LLSFGDTEGFVVEEGVGAVEPSLGHCHTAFGARFEVSTFGELLGDSLLSFEVFVVRFGGVFAGVADFVD